MSTATIPSHMTAEEFFDWCHQPENSDRHFELVRGEVTEMSRPGERHGFVCFNLGGILWTYIRQRRAGYACSNDTGLLLERDPDTVRGPDLVLYTQPRRYDDLKVRYSSEPPTLAIEVLSPNDKWGTITRRVNQFLQRGVGVLWLVDPDGRTVTVYRMNALPQVLEGEDELVCEDLLPGFHCRVSEFFYMPGEDNPPPTPPPPQS